MQGLLADFLVRSTGEEASRRVNMGSGSDSAYEYLLKYWLLGGKQVGTAGGYCCLVVLHA